MKRFLFLLALCWTLSWVVIFMDRGNALPDAPANRPGFLMGEAFVAITVLVLIRLSRRTKPIDHQSELPIRQPGWEIVGILIYMLLVLAIGARLGVRAHVASVGGLTDANLHAYDAHTPQSLLLWAGYNFIFEALIPFLIFTLGRGYSLKTLLLTFPRAKRWVPYCIITGAFGVLAFVGPSYWKLSILGHVVSVLLFSLGTFIPVMILIQSLLAPRFAILTRSWVTGSALAGLAYGVYHLGEFFMAWSSPTGILVSLAWSMQFVFFGFLKGLTTLRTGNAWIHIFNTHTPHLSEAPEVVRILGIR